MVHLTKAEFLLQLSNQDVAVSYFINAYDLDLKKETDAIRLIEYYNSLLSPQPKQKKVQG